MSVEILHRLCTHIYLFCWAMKYCFHLSVRLLINQFSFLLIYLYIYLIISIPISLSTDLPIHLPTYLFIYLPIYQSCLIPLFMIIPCKSLLCWVYSKSEYVFMARKLYDAISLCARIWPPSDFLFIPKLNYPWSMKVGFQCKYPPNMMQCPIHCL